VTIVKGCVIAAIALLAGVWAEPVRADEAYICDGGRVVHVKPGQIEALKLSDPCIAKYFETTPRVERQVTVAAPTPAKPATPERANDFRNVRIINAEPGTNPWFQHRR
jgi:hypothetical protein